MTKARTFLEQVGIASAWYWVRWVESWTNRLLLKRIGFSCRNERRKIRVADVIVPEGFKSSSEHHPYRLYGLDVDLRLWLRRDFVTVRTNCWWEHILNSTIWSHRAVYFVGFDQVLRHIANFKLFLIIINWKLSIPWICKSIARWRKSYYIIVRTYTSNLMTNFSSTTV